MAVIPFRGFGGEIPRLPIHMLPEPAAAYALNCDLAHGELRGLRGNLTLASGIKGVVDGRAIRSVYTENGTAFFGWAYDAYVVKSQVVDDLHYRIYYTLLLDDGPIIKVARTKLEDGTPVIGSARIGGNYQPPENTNPPPVGSGFAGPDSWVLGVPAPRAQGVADADLMTISLDDRHEWPGMPRMALRVIYFLENPTGQIVAQLDISNNETANRPDVLSAFDGRPWVHENVFFTAYGDPFPAHKIQDLLSALGPSQRPYKYYFFDPPDLETVPIARTLIIDNTGPGNIAVEYGASVPDPTPGIPGEAPPGSSGGTPIEGGQGGDGSSGDTGGGGDGGGDGGDSA